ncbi:hypothetical protein FGO68_gene977 [Halteria grandinella]|uniref:Methyltransferase domain-containing protein n=1 Tax=Halteria grandinella TaxID=5974 RepID=A0A8J8NII8_HALGN|nr:hypothetical protein FGO68_gene977 [Halteria grandinella]
MFEDEEESKHSVEILTYDFPVSKIQLQIKTMKLHVGVSRSVWKASVIMARYLETLLPDLQNVNTVLELGSGTGLGGIFARTLLKEAETVYMTDICTKSLQMIRENILLNMTSGEISVNYLEWGKHDINHELNDDKAFPTEHQGQFDLIIASDVVYIPECLQPLLQSIKHFMKPTGTCLLVNNRIRQDLFIDRFDGMLDQAGLKKSKEDEVIEGADKFKVYLLTHQ